MPLRPEHAQEIRDQVDKELSRYAALFGIPSLLAVLAASGSAIFFVFWMLPDLVRAQVTTHTTISQGLTRAANEGFQAIGRAEGAAKSAEQDANRIKERLKEFDTLLSLPEGERATRLATVLRILNDENLAKSLEAAQTTIVCGTRGVADHLGPPWAEAGVSSADRRDSVIRVFFPSAFRSRPHVFVAWSGIDGSAVPGGAVDAAADYSVYASHVDAKGFDLHVVTRSNHKLDDSRVSWIALGNGGVSDSSDGSCVPRP